MKIIDGADARPPRPSQSQFIPSCMSCSPALFHGWADRVSMSPTEEDENDALKEREKEERIRMSGERDGVRNHRHVH